MKRGFLLGAEDRKAAVKRRDAQKQTEPLAPSTFASEPPQNPNGEDGHTTRVSRTNLIVGFRFQCRQSRKPLSKSALQ